MSFTSVGAIFHIDRLSIMMICLVSFIGIVVYFFSRTYMKGDAIYRKFSWNLLILLLSVILIAISDNLLLFLTAWCSCHWILVQLMIHKSAWKAAKASGRLAVGNFALGFVFILFAFVFLSKSIGSFSIQSIVQNPTHSWWMFVALVLLVMGVMTQSAIWPFHRWLISSLNSPTPVSAIMHAGIVNGGGFLLARFAPLYLSAPKMLFVIFVMGWVSALLGSLWKLMQHDVKRMLAYSTVGQMGFMFIQIGLGLFPSALAHLCWHGIFKAYLFLASGNAAKEKRLDLVQMPSLPCFLLSLVCGALGVYVFGIINHKNGFPLDTSLFVVGIVFVAGVQIALTVFQGAFLKKLPLAMMLTAAMAAVYGINIYFFDFIFSPLAFMQPQPLVTLHLVALLVFGLVWLFVLFARHSSNKMELPVWLLRFYVKALNSSQPHSDTVTGHRKGYDYV